MIIPTELYGNTLRAWLIALGTVVAAYLLLGLIYRLLSKRLTVLSQRTTTTWDDAVAAALRGTSSLFLLVIALLAGASVLVLTERMVIGLRTVAVLAFLIQAGVWTTIAARTLLGRYQAVHLETDRSAATIAIVLDKPFVLRDFIIVDNCLGTVDHIGLKTTRLRSLSGEQLIFSNADLLKSRIRNYGRMFERRVVFTIRATY